MVLPNGKTLKCLEDVDKEWSSAISLHNFWLYVWWGVRVFHGAFCIISTYSMLNVRSQWRGKGQQWDPWRVGGVQEVEHGGITKNSWTCHHELYGNSRTINVLMF